MTDQERIKHILDYIIKFLRDGAVIYPRFNGGFKSYLGGIDRLLYKTS